MQNPMLAIEISHYGAPGVLQLCERPVPIAGAGEVVIQVRASGVNRPDVAQRKGLYPPPVGASDIPGLEVSGVLVAGDPQALSEAGLALGDAVCALVTGGGYAQYVAAPIEQCLPVPMGLDMLSAACIPETFFTVYSNVFMRGGLQAGESILIHGGASGIGTTAIQLAKAAGALVICTVGSEAKVAACRALGADLAIPYRETDFVQATLDATAGKGVDVVLDMVAGDYIGREVGCMAEDGRIVVIATQGGKNVTFDMLQFYRKRLTLTGSTLRARPIAFKAQIAQHLRTDIWPWLESGRVKPIIHKVFAPHEAAVAHELMESNGHIGKLVIDWRL